METGIESEELSAHDKLYLRQYLFHVLEQEALGGDPSAWNRFRRRAKRKARGSIPGVRKP